jgi:hypothetical protein
VASTVKTKESPWAELLWARLVQFGPDPACWDWLREQLPDPDAIDLHAPEFRDALRLAAADWAADDHPDGETASKNADGTTDFGYCTLAGAVRLGDFGSLDGAVMNMRANRIGPLTHENEQARLEAYFARALRARDVLVYVEGIP